jgi:Tfp pilus assembly protein FimT
LELVLVMTILVIVAAISYPSLDAMYGSFKVTAAADTVRAAMAQARAHAMAEGCSYRFCVVPNQGNFRVAPDGGDYWASNNSPPAGLDPANPPLVMEDVLPKGVRFGDSGGNSGSSSLEPGSVDSTMWTGSAVFLPDGTAQDDAELIIRCRGARPVVIRIRGITGVVTTRPL